MVAPFHLEPLLTRSPRRVQLGVSPPPAGPQPTPAPSPGCAPETGSESSRPRGPRPVLGLRGVEAACRPSPARRGVRLHPRALSRALPPHGEAPETPRTGGGGIVCSFVCSFICLGPWPEGRPLFLTREAAPRPPQRASAWLGCGGAWEAFQKRRERLAGGQRLPQGQTRPFRTGR